MSLKESFIGSVTSSSDLRSVYDFVRKILGDDIISFEQFKTMQDVNPLISHNIKRTLDKGQDQICGFVSLSFLTSSALVGLRSKTLSTLDLNGTHQVNRQSVPAAIYVGAIGADSDKEARRATMKYFDTIMVNYKHKFNNCLIISKPITDEGLAVISKRGFRPMHDVAGLGQLYEL
ncbi:MAG: hypothetical protein CMH26_06780 [Micavibrio sp.]|nr:hypothetical protein [Micavibrio sp.]|tara:strand:- start:530 stop:1057 length:528 start_codon:yes stop_codon:yes gene_type:complete